MYLFHISHLEEIFMRQHILFPILVLLCILNTNSIAGLSNPDISASGQFFGTYINNGTDETKVVPSMGETEVVLDAALNPFVNGTFVFAIGDEGFGIEEAYTSFIRGLPLDLAAKIGKYRVPFGKLNNVHPHAYPFLRTPHTLNPEETGLLPGEESFNDLGVQLSLLIPFIKSWTITLSGDFLEGTSFHPDTEATTYAWLGHISNAFFMGEKWATDIGLSVTGGINNPENETKTFATGIDCKVKGQFNPQLTITLGSEFIYNRTDEIDTVGIKRLTEKNGLYAYGDLHLFNRYNLGLLYERWGDSNGYNFSIKPFIGFAILEESTVFRFAYEYLNRIDESNIHTAEVQLVFVMGTHKTHKF